MAVVRPGCRSTMADPPARRVHAGGAFLLGSSPTAVAMSARQSVLVSRLILQSAAGPLPWPDRRTYVGAQVVLAPRTERTTWAVVYALTRHAPDAGLRPLLRDLTVLPVRENDDGLPSPEHRAILLARMRSGQGLVNDIRDLKSGPDVKRLLAEASQPALVTGRPPGRRRAVHACPGPRLGAQA